MRDHYTDWTGNRDFYSVMNCIFEHQEKVARKRRVRRVRAYLWSRAWREVRRGKIFTILAGLILGMVLIEIFG